MINLTNPEHVVGLVPCSGYETDCVGEAVAEAINLIGGISRFISPGMHVLVKPNLLMGAAPDRAVCTHPAVVFAVCQIIILHGCTVTIADSPGAGIPYRAKNLKKAYDEAGYTFLSSIPGVTLNEDTRSETISYPDGSLIKQFEIIKPVIDADAIISISKFKTHVYTGMTGAVKNLFGVIPGLDKPPFHALFQDDILFGRMLLDLNRCIGPVLQIMDAVDIMEGNGPMSGNPCRLGVILASPDYTALDIVACRLTGFDPATIGSINASYQQGLIEEDQILVRGASVKDYAKPAIEKPKTRFNVSSSWKRHLLLPLFNWVCRSYSLQPKLVKRSCTRCYKCQRICPVKAITLHNGYPRIDMKKCIRCYCCHEMCDSHALHLKPGILHLIVRPFIR